MTIKPTVSIANNAWLHLLEDIAGKGKASKAFSEDVYYIVPMNDPVVTFFHADPSYYSTLLCNAQTFLRGFGDVPRQLDNVIDCLERDPEHPNATVYIHGAPYSSITFALIQGRLQCNVTLCAVDVWNDLPRRTVELAVLSAYVCLGIRKRRIECQLGGIQLKIGQAYLPQDRVSPAIAALWASGLGVNYMTRFPQSPITMDVLMSSTLNGHTSDLINAVDDYKDALSNA